MADPSRDRSAFGEHPAAERHQRLGSTVHGAYGRGKLEFHAHCGRQFGVYRSSRGLRARGIAISGNTGVTGAASDGNCPREASRVQTRDDNVRGMRGWLQDDNFAADREKYR
jgi:hypothetical protein